MMNKGKVFSCFMLALMVAACLTFLGTDAQAADFVAGGGCGENVAWMLDSDGVLTVSGSGRMRGYGTAETPWYKFRSDIKSVIIENGVTTVGSSAFENCYNLTSAVIADSVSVINDRAFYDCGLTSIIIPDGVNSIGTRAFAECGSLRQIDLPDSLETIGPMAFTSSGLNSVNIPDSVIAIGHSAFEWCTSLREVTLSKSLRNIAYNAFYGCYNLVDIVIPDSVNKIDKAAFQNCFSLSCVTIPSSVTEIGSSAFSDTEKLWHILYRGTEAQWNEISMDTFCRRRLDNVQRHYNYTVDEGIDSYKQTCATCMSTCTHQWGDFTVTKAPTCGAEGEKTYRCKLCGKVKTEPIEKSDTHKYDASCDADCNICGETRSTSHTWDNGAVTKEPTCAEEGVKTYVCSICRGTKTEAIAKLDGHSYGSWWVKGGDVNNHRRTCSGCGQEEIEAHAWDSGVVTKEPTCDAEGAIIYACTVCASAKTEAIAKLNDHSYGEWVKEDNNDHKRTCKGCGKEETAAHSWDSGAVTKKPTCDADGIKTYTCSVCGGTKTEAVPMLNAHTYDHDCDTACNVCGMTREVSHQYGEGWTTDKDHHWYECTICGEKKDAADHAPGADATEETDQTCTTCGYVIVPALGHTHKWEESYRVDAKGHWYVCSGCEEKKDAAQHIFDHDCDTDCNVCGYARVTEHVPGPEPTETEDQVCTVCGALLKPAIGNVDQPSEPTQPGESVTDPTQPSKPENEPTPTNPKEPVNTATVVIAAAAGVLVIGGGAALLVRKKKG